MKQITLKSISIRNFKGIKELDFTFSGTRAHISGENGTGKTTVFDAFTWLLFGKDSSDRKEFGIIPLTQDNDPIQVDSEVTAVLDEDGAEITLQRVHHQKWVKRRGSTETVYDGNETKFYYNGVPQKANEFKQKIEAIMNEAVFKLITNPMYFNSIAWQNRREVLTEMAGEVSYDDILTRMNGQADNLAKVLNKGLSVEEYRTEISARKKKLKDDLEGIPTRIDELNKFMPEAVDENAIQKQIDEKQTALDEIDGQIADANKQTDEQAEAYRSLRDSLNNLKDQAEDIRRNRKQALENSVREEIEAGEKIIQEIARLDREIESKEREKKFQEEGLNADQSAMEKARENWQAVNAETLKFDEDKFSCPTCKRPYEDVDIDSKKAEMTQSFTKDKMERLDKINLQGVELKGRVQDYQKVIKEMGDQIDTLKAQKKEQEDRLIKHPKPEVPDVDVALATDKEYLEITNSITELEEKLKAPTQPVDIDSHKEMKRTITAVMDDLKKQLTVNESRKKTQDRIAELKKEEDKWAQLLADLERVEFSITEFIKARTDLIESRINDKFSHVRFKMFKQNINGGEEETCETLIDGVPFTDANNAARVNAGLDIINALSAHYGITAPIFIDNKESVNDLIDCKSQLINLVVTRDEVLTLS